MNHLTLCWQPLRAPSVPRRLVLQFKATKRTIYSDDIFLGLGSDKAEKLARDYQAATDRAYFPPGPVREAYKAAFQKIHGRPEDAETFPLIADIWDYMGYEVNHLVQVWHRLGFSDRSELQTTSEPYLSYSRRAIETCEKRGGTSYFYLGGGFDVARHFRDIAKVQLETGDFDAYAGSVSFAALERQSKPSISFTGLELHDYLWGPLKDKLFVPLADNGLALGRETLAKLYREAYELVRSPQNMEHFGNTRQLGPAAQEAVTRLHAFMQCGELFLLVTETDKTIFPGSGAGHVPF